jgi:hypothetical protein
VALFRIKKGHQYKIEIMILGMLVFKRKMNSQMIHSRLTVAMRMKKRRIASMIPSKKK